MKDILKFVQNFSKVRRWSQIHCAREESSLEHTAATALIALKIGSDCPFHVNVSELLTRALLHDIEEVITGDIMTPIKYHPALVAAVKELEKEAALEAAGVFGPWAIHYWENAKDDTIEGQIVKIADKASVVYKYRQELELGNKSFEQYEENIWNALHDIKQEVNEKLHPYIHDLMDYLQEK